MSCDVERAIAFIRKSPDKRLVNVKAELEKLIEAGKASETSKEKARPEKATGTTEDTQSIDKKEKTAHEGIKELIDMYAGEWTTVIGDEVGYVDENGVPYTRNRRKKVDTIAGEFWNNIGFTKRMYNSLVKAVEKFDNMVPKPKWTDKQREAYDELMSISPEVIEEAKRYADMAWNSTPVYMAYGPKKPVRIDGKYYKTMRDIVDEVVKPEVVESDKITFSTAKLKDIVVTAGQYHNGQIKLGVMHDDTYYKEARRILEEYYGDKKYGDMVDVEAYTKSIVADMEIQGLVEKEYKKLAARLMTEYVNARSSHALEHEYVHAGAADFMKANPEHEGTKKVQALYEEALENSEWITKSMLGTGADIKEATYWEKSVDEFLAEALTNPKLMAALQGIKTKHGRLPVSRILRTLVETVLDMLGVKKKDTMYEHILDGYMSIVEAQQDDSKSLIDKLGLYTHKLEERNVKGSDQFADKAYWRAKKKITNDTVAEMVGTYGSFVMRDGSGRAFTFIKDARYIPYMDQIEIEVQDAFKGTKNHKIRIEAETGRNAEWQLEGYSRAKSVRNSDPEGLNVRPGMSDTDVLEMEGKLTPQKKSEEVEEGQTDTSIEGYFRGFYDMDAENGRKITSPEFAQQLSDTIKIYQETAEKIDMDNIDVEVFKNKVLETAGEIDLDKNKMRVRWNAMSSSATASEIFLHELSHVIAKDVFKENLDLRNLIKDLRESAMKSGVDYTVFLPEGDYTDRDLEIAKRKFDYVFYGEEEEFYAYVVSNEKVYEAVKDVKIDTKLFKEYEAEKGESGYAFKRIANAFIKAVNNVWLGLTGRKSKGSVIVANMVKTVANTAIELDSRRRAEAQEESSVIVKQYQRMDDKLSGIIEQKERLIDSIAEKSKKPSKAIEKSLRKIGVLNSFLDTGIPQYLFRTFTQDTTKKDVAKLYETHRQSKDYIEKHTMQIRNALKERVNEMYEGVEEFDKRVIKTVVLDFDGAAIGDFEEITRVVESRDVLKKEIEELEKGLSEGVLEQSKGLAKYLVHGETVGYKQQMNANNIVLEFDNQAYDHKSRKALKIKHGEKVAKVDKLVSLYALDEMSDRDLANIKDVLGRNKEVAKDTLSMYKNYIEDMRVQLGSTSLYDSVTKGYHKAEDGEFKYTLVPENEVEAQLEVNMKLVDDENDYHIIKRYKNVKMEERLRKVEPHVVVDGVKYYMMKGRIRSTGFQEGALGVISNTAEGVTLSSLVRKNYGVNEHEKLLNGSVDSKIKMIVDEMHTLGRSESMVLPENRTIVPVYDQAGKVIDYRLQMTKLQKEIELDQDNSIEGILSNTFSRSTKTHLTKEYNEVVVEVLIEDAGRRMSEDPDDFVVIEEYTKDMELAGVKYEKRHERWDKLPEYTKEYIMKRLGVKGIPIHKDFVEMMTGEKDVTLGNMKLGSFDMKKHPKARARVMALEEYSREILGIVKRTLILLDAGIVVGNIVSNSVVAAVHGVDPITYVKEMKENWKLLNEYNELLKKKAMLEVDEKAGKDVSGKIQNINKRLENSPVHELVMDGQFTPIAEDINTESTPEGTLSGILEKGINNNKFGDVIKGVRNVLYIDKHSRLGNLALKNTQYQDAMTRLVVIKAMKKKVARRKGVRVDNLSEKDRQDILNYSSQLLVYYGDVMNRYVNYAEKVLGVLFLRYYLGQAKASVAMITKNPMGALGLGLEQQIGLDVPDPFETYNNSPINAIAARLAHGDSIEEILKPNLLNMIGQ